MKVSSQDSRDLRSGFWVTTGSHKPSSLPTSFHLMGEFVVKIPMMPSQSVMHGQFILEANM